MPEEPTLDRVLLQGVLRDLSRERDRLSEAFLLQQELIKAKLGATLYLAGMRAQLQAGHQLTDEQLRRIGVGMSLQSLDQSNIKPQNAAHYREVIEILKDLYQPNQPEENGST